MATIKVEGVPPFDGSYPFDASKFNGRELHAIKEISGVRAGELGEALAAGDYDLVVAFTVVVLRRAGLAVHPDQILEADIGSITVDLDDEAVVERPPVSASPSGDSNRPGDDGKQSEHTHSSGGGSSNGSDTLPSLPSPTGRAG